MKILLIHGLGRSPFSLSGLGKALSQAGHTPEFFGYTTLIESFDKIVERLRDRIQTLSQQTNGKYGIVTHSMGAVLLRAALDSAPFALPDHVVMLAPPNQSPRIARIAQHLIPFLWFAGQSGKNLASTEFYAKLAPLNCSYTIVTGTVGFKGDLSPFGAEVNDFVIGAEESRIYPHDELIEVPALHSFIMNNKSAQEIVISAFSETKQTTTTPPVQVDPA